MTNVIVYNRPWCRNLPVMLEKRTGIQFVAIDYKKDLTPENLRGISPDYVFFPHWSSIIPKKIFQEFHCVIFHMTDLPYGRGGSPLQNLIVRGHKETVVCAIQCVEEVDAGPIYLKKPLSLEGSAEEIFIRVSEVIEEMIVEMLKKNPKPIPQKGEVVKFQRRKPEDGDWSKVESLDGVFDHIRMLDAEGYPPAFIRIGKYKLEFSEAFRKVETIHASVKIILDETDE